MEVSEIVEQIRSLPDAYVDCGFLQGRDAISRQLQQRDGEYSNTAKHQQQYDIDKDAAADKFISFMQEAITELIERAKPYEIPKEYITFLQRYGGIMIDREGYNFSTYGIGPMVEDWYGYLNTADHVLMETGKSGWLSLGHLVFRKGKNKYQRVEFLLDLGNVVRRNGVIGVGPWDGRESEELILSNLQTQIDKWKIISNSFVEWLELARHSKGEFVYK